jgi:hypothetical protein
MRMRIARQTLLRLLQPFLNRQSELDARQSAWLAILTEEVANLRRHVTELEERDQGRDQGKEQDSDIALSIDEDSPATGRNR